MMLSSSTLKPIPSDFKASHEFFYITQNPLIQSQYQVDHLRVQMRHFFQSLKETSSGVCFSTFYTLTGIAKTFCRVRRRPGTLDCFQNYVTCPQARRLYKSKQIARSFVLAKVTPDHDMSHLFSSGSV